jgi:hypothetical protein
MSKVDDSSDMEVEHDVFPPAGTSGCHRQTSSVGKSCGRELPQSPADIAKRRASEFLSSISESPAKKQRLDNANKIRKLETDRMRLVNRNKKTKQRMRELHKTLTDEELDLIKIDRAVAKLKNEFPDA